MNVDEKEKRIIESLEQFNEQNPARIVQAALALCSDIKDFHKNKSLYINTAFDILCGLEEKNKVKNINRLPIPTTPKNREQIIKASQWVIIK